MKTQTNCFSCEAQGINTPADTEIYIGAIGEIAPVCHDCMKELSLESVSAEEEEIEFYDDNYDG